MKEWIPTSQIEPADLERRVVSGRFGSSIMFVAFFQLTGWQWIFGGGEKSIPEPPLLLLDPIWAKAHPRKSPIVHTEKPHLLRKQKTDQLTLGL